MTNLTRANLQGDDLRMGNVNQAERLITLARPLSIASEAYRGLLANLFYSPQVTNSLKVIVLTSPGVGEGASTTCANLGVVLAQARKNTLLLDYDPGVDAILWLFGIGSSKRSVDVLANQSNLPKIWHEPLPGLKVVPAGHILYDSSELSNSSRFSEFLVSARREFDYVLISAPPVCMAAQTAVLAAQGDGVVLVFDSQKTSKRDMLLGVRTLVRVEANLLGTVMTNVG